VLIDKTVCILGEIFPCPELATKQANANQAKIMIMRPLHYLLFCSLMAYATCAPWAARRDGAVRPCADEDIEGAWSDTRIIGGSDTFEAGTRQTVTWVYAAGSAIDGIDALDIVSDTGARYKPVDLTELPTDLAGGADQVGGMMLTLPADLPEGRYTFLATLTTPREGDRCAVETAAFRVSPFREECAATETICTSMDTYRICTGGKWSGDVSCRGGQACVSGRCALQSGGVPCFPGHQRCLNGTAWVQCQQDAAGGWVEGEAQACNFGARCVTYLQDYIVCA
jgi:hypothetical protein